MDFVNASSLKIITMLAVNSLLPAWYLNFLIRTSITIILCYCFLICYGQTGYRYRNNTTVTNPDYLRVRLPNCILDKNPPVTSPDIVVIAQCINSKMVNTTMPKFHYRACHQAEEFTMPKSRGVSSLVRTIHHAQISWHVTTSQRFTMPKSHGVSPILKCLPGPNLRACHQPETVTKPKSHGVTAPVRNSHHAPNLMAYVTDQAELFTVPQITCHPPVRTKSPCPNLTT